MRYRYKKNGNQGDNLVVKRTHLCMTCKYENEKKWDNCPECGSKDRQYFASKTELRRAKQLIFLQEQNIITRLIFQKRFDLSVNNIKLGVYIADACYYDENNQFVVEDSKNPKFVEPLSKWKISHFEAQYGIKISIPQQRR